MAVTECATDDTLCDITDSCSLASNWGGINQLITQVLSRVTLEDIRQPERQLRLVREAVPLTSLIELVNLP